ncbi:hypothetical protein [Streptomyces sp. NPDC052811]|uniref:hypothetical protein n=1 Tax=Streptomyces sp. NPDC052811 TaxID=3155731 RepID=UPI003444943C
MDRAGPASPGGTYVTAWRRPGAEPTTSLRLPHLLGSDVRADVLYPASSKAVTLWRPDTAELTLTLPAAPSAVLLHLNSRSQKGS